MHTIELSDLTFFFKMFTVSLLQSIDEDKKKMPVNILGKKFKVTKSTQYAWILES